MNQPSFSTIRTQPSVFTLRDHIGKAGPILHSISMECKRVGVKGLVHVAQVSLPECSALGDKGQFPFTTAHFPQGSGGKKQAEFGFPHFLAKLHLHTISH